MHRKYFYPIVLFIAIALSAQLSGQTDQSYRFFEDTNVPRIDITVSPSSLIYMYNNVYSDSEHVASFRFKSNSTDVSVDTIGFRLRGNTSRTAKKKSFKVSFNSFSKGKKVFGMEKLDLNGEHNDPSIIRSKLCFDHFRKLGIPASRANHIALYINGQYYGLYINVEHIDEEFIDKNYPDNSGNLWKCLYPADLTYKGSDPAIYIGLNNNGTPVYELSTNEELMDFSKLIRLISILNNTTGTAFSDSIENVLDIASVLKYFALNLLAGSWDDYRGLANNYYLYHQPNDDKFRLIPYDYDNTFGVDWSGNNWTSADPYNFPKVNAGARPLSEKLFSNNTYRNLYTRFVSFFRTNSFLLNLWESRIDSIKNMITPFAAIDTFRVKDYSFTMSDFSNSYSASSFSLKHVKTGLKQFVNARNNLVNSQLSYRLADPIVYKIDYLPKTPGKFDSVKVIASVFGYPDLAEVSIRFTRDGSLTEETYMMYPSPVAGSKIVEEADRYIGYIPLLGNTMGGFFVVLAKDIQNRIVRYPRGKVFRVNVDSSSNSSILLNEFLADNINGPTDPAGDHDDYVEIYNKSNAPVLLTGKYLTDNPLNLKKWRFIQENLFINPNEKLVLWCDEQQTQPGLHTNFKLSKSGEYLALTDTNGFSILDSISFGIQKTDTSYGRIPDGSIKWKYMQPTPGTANLITFSLPEGKQYGFALKQNYPNPFNPSTKIEYEIPGTSALYGVSLKVYDMLGRLVDVIFEGYQTGGEYYAEFPSKENTGKYPSGVYFYELKVTNDKEEITRFRKMIMMK